MIGHGMIEERCHACGLWEENQSLRDQNKYLEERLQRIEAENASLKRCLQHYENIQPARRRRLRRRRRKIATTARFPGRPRGYPGTTRPRPGPPQEILQADRVQNCPECGEHLSEPVYTKHRILEELPSLEPVRVVDYHEDHYLCSGCDCNIVARHPDCPPTGRFGKNVYVQTTLLKFEERLPLDKMGMVLDRQGLGVTDATILELLWRAANWLRPEYERILAQVRSSSVVHTDQTGMKVDGDQNWIWTYTTRAETLYAIRDSKGKRILEEVLGNNWPGILVCDGLRSHHAYTKKIQRCWAHLLREADELVQEAREEGREEEEIDEAQALAKALHTIFDKVREALGKDPPPEERKKLDRQVRRVFKHWTGKQYKTHRVRKFVEKAKRGYPYWFTYITHPGMEPTNNKAERALKELVIQRKIIGTLRNGKGVFIYETLATLITTWKQRGLDPTQTLSNALTNNWTNTTS
jgi:transposase